MSLEVSGAPDYVLVGHVTRDLIPGGSQLGGTAAYAALTAAAFGLRVGVVTACEASYDLSALAALRVIRQPSSQTTTFENRYPTGVREQILHSLAAPLGAEAPPPEWRGAAIVHLAPVAAEVEPALAAHAAPQTLGVTPQGWMRQWDRRGKVSRVVRPEAEAAMGKASACVFSLEDVGGDEREVGRLSELCPITVVTENAGGCRAYWNGHVRNFPAPEVQVVDPTGAGDIFAACFFVRLHETRDPWEAARLATQLASLSVTRRGLAGIPTSAEVAAGKLVVERS